MKIYKHYQIAPETDGQIKVFDPRWPDNPVYVADTLASAKRWVTDFRRGRQWAVNAYQQ